MQPIGNLYNLIVIYISYIILYDFSNLALCLRIPLYKSKTSHYLTDFSCYSSINNESDEELESNIYSPWSVEEDRILYEFYNSGKSLDDLCTILKRGPNGIKSRLKHLSNPDHKACIRLFGGKMPVVDGNNLDNRYLRPCKEVIERIIWDNEMHLPDFSFTYIDRFDGYITALINESNKNIKGKERLLVKAVPEHRIERISYKERIIWDKKQRLDYVFGNNNESLTLRDVISTYDDWQEEQESRRQESLQNTVIYCDLDGVLADFEAGVRQLLGRKSSEISKKILWSSIARTKDFYSSLPWTEDGRLLWDSIAPYDPIVLTGCPNGNSSQAAREKRLWCATHLGEHVPVITCYTKEKPLYCTTGNAILIDDRQLVEQSWNAAGGVFIHHKTSLTTIAALRDMGIPIVADTLSDPNEEFEGNLINNYHSEEE